MQLIFYGVSDNEKQFIEKWSETREIPVTIVEEGVTLENIHLAKDHDGICLYPTAEMKDNELLYRKINEYGIYHLSIKSTGVDGVNFDLAKKYDLTVMNVPGYSPTSIGHFTIMSILMLLRDTANILPRDAKQNRPLGRELGEVTIGILGTGRIGKVVCESLTRLGAKVIASSRTVNQNLSQIVEYVSFDELLKRSDVLSIHVPLTPKTEYLFSKDEFSMMKNDALLINTARGKIVDTAALVESLKAGELGGVALDALEDEEQYFRTDWKQNPWYEKLEPLENVFLTPHIAFYTSCAVQEITETALENAMNFVLEGTSKNCVIAS